MDKEERYNTVYWEHGLDSIPPIAEKNIVFCLNMFPAGLTELELRKLCKDNPKWFGDYEELKILDQGIGEQRKKLPY